MDKLLDKIFIEIELEDDSKGTVEDALERALANTTPERAGCPWDDRKPDGTDKDLQ